MSMVNEKLMAHREKAAEERAKYNDQMARIAADKDLSDEGRQRQQAQAFVTTRSRLDDLRKSEQEELTTRWHRLQAEMFGPPPAYGSDTATRTISARDASERASQIRSVAEAADGLQTAEFDRDEVMARAIARRCIERSYQVSQREASAWESVFSDFASRRPNLSSKIDELAQIEDMSKPGMFSPYSLATPHGVPPQLINSTRSDELADA